MRAAGARSFWPYMALAIAIAIAGLPACGSSGDAGDPQPPGPDAAVLPPADDGSAPAPDAGVDAADAAPDVITPTGSRYCAKVIPVPRFCDDFDDGDLTNDWTQFVAPNGSLFQLNRQLFRVPW